MRNVLVTGFEAFAGDAVNPSAEVARALDGRVIEGRRVVAAVLPCVFDACAVELNRLQRRHRPELILCLGMARGRAGITVERIAINLDDARIPDNAGGRRIDRPVVRGGPAGYWSTLPVKAIVAALRRRGIAAGASETAGTFVCNHLFYHLMHGLARHRGVRGGFIHVPPLPVQAGKVQPSLPLARMIQAAAIAIAVTAKSG